MPIEKPEFDTENEEGSDTPVTITGGNNVYKADVILEDGIRKLAVSKKVEVDSLSGRQQSATNYFTIGDVTDGDTLRLEIDATELSPALDKTFTVTGGEDKFEFASRIVLELNQDFVNFQPYFRAIQVDDNAIVFILAKNIAEAGENTTLNSFRTTGTGLTVTRAFDDFVRRTSVVQASQSTADPRLAIFGISGTVESRDASVEGLFFVQPYRDGNPALVGMNIDADAGSGFKTFTFPMDSLNDIFVTEIRFFGKGNGIQFGSFLNIATIANGILVEIKTDNNIVSFPAIRTTEDFADKFSFGGGDNFQLYIQSGADKFTASFIASAFPLRRAGTFGVGNDDYIKITIRDDIDQVAQLESAVVGFLQEA